MPPPPLFIELRQIDAHAPIYSRAIEATAACFRDNICRHHHDNAQRCQYAAAPTRRSAMSHYHAAAALCTPRSHRFDECAWAMRHAINKPADVFSFRY